VRAHAALGGLFDIQVDRGSVGGHPDRYPQPRCGGAVPPPRTGVEPVQVGDVQQVGQVEQGAQSVGSLVAGDLGVVPSHHPREAAQPR